MRNHQMPHIFVLRLAAVLLILVMLSTSMLAGRYARYVSTGSGSDSARVARFSVTEESELLTQDIMFGISPAESDSVAIQVRNDSEVAIQYTVDLVNSTGNLPMEFSVKAGENTYPLPFSGDMAPDSQEQYLLIASWDGAADPSFGGMVDLVQLRLQAIQLD